MFEFTAPLEFTPRTDCSVNVQSSTPQIMRPFGQLPNQAASNLYSAQMKPYTTLLGFGAGPGYDKLQGQLESGKAQGPLADLIKGIQGFSPDVVNQAAGVGNKIAGAAPGVYEGVKSQIQSALAALPGMQAGAAGATNLAQGGLTDAYSPVRDSAIYQQSLNRVLPTLRAGTAARGLEGGGAAQAGEEQVAQNLSLATAQNALANQNAAQQTYAGALGNQAGLQQAGIGIAQQGYGNLASYAQTLSQQFGIPMAAAGALAQLLMGGQQGQLNLVQGTAPTVSQSSQGVGVL